jgi:hypothetical protein
LKRFADLDHYVSENQYSYPFGQQVLGTGCFECERNFSQMALPFGDEHLWAAWERVQENEGCAGVDGVTVRQFSERAHKRLPELRDRVNTGLYRPLSLSKNTLDTQIPEHF